MSFESIVRPFQAKRVLTVERVAKPPVVTVRPADDPTAAILIWGAAGSIPEGVLQENKGRDLLVVGFNTREHKEKWVQSGTPKTEEVAMPPPNEDVHVKRVREIEFSTIKQSSSDFNKTTSAAVTSAARDSMDGVRAEIPANRSVSATYKTTWD